MKGTTLFSCTMRQTLLVLLSVFCVGNIFAQRNVRDSTLNFFSVGIFGGVQQPFADLNERFGAGGIAGGADAYAMIRAGASLVQIYSALVFHGPALVPRIKTELAARLRADGFACLDEAVGADHR